MHDIYEESVALLGDTSPAIEEQKEIAPHAAKPRTTFKPSQWFILTLFALTVADVAVSLYVARMLLFTADTDPDALELRSQYVGLDDLYGSGVINASHYPPIVNMPRLAAQVNSTDPHKVSLEDEHRHLTNFGTLSPPDRHLQVSHDTHTLLQFRVMDYGMERCALALRLPPPEFGPSQDITESNSSSIVRLDVCMLDAPRLLDARKLSWSSRSRCLKHIGTLAARAGEEVQLPDFPCGWGSLHTYEVACASEESQCDVDVWSQKHQPWGIFLYQFQTV